MKCEFQGDLWLKKRNERVISCPKSYLKVIHNFVNLKNNGTACKSAI